MIEPLERQAGESSDPLRVLARTLWNQRREEIAPCPRQCRTGSRHRAALELAEVAKQPAVAQQREPREVVALLMHLLHERQLGVDEAIRCEHAMDLGDAAHG